ncbi:GOLPH3/VPS74 family protein [Catenulispora pinisilvae]|uniref:GOLPH3/VPS74 family protein n=1 Tax=Catenulispora pinisilvae TaxID=2705253 RepID=UPI001891C443|nr:GPP34 family phosphoprotein [Catenulispora pinisilvae]
MLTLGEELLLVALDADKGVLRGSAAIQVGLNAAGIAELLAQGRLQLRQADGSPGVTVVERGTSDFDEEPLLEQVLLEVRQTQKGDRHPERCLKNWRSPSLFAYLKSLRGREVLTWDRPQNRAALYGRFHLLDTDAAASARARVERVATGADPSERDVSLAAIVQGLGLDEVLYKGRRNRPKRAALATVLARNRFAVMVGRVLPEIPGQKFTFDSKNDMKMAIEMVQAWDRTP